MEKRRSKLIPIVLSSSILLSNTVHAEEDPYCPIQCELTEKYFVEPFYESYLTGTAEESRLFRKQMKKKGKDQFIREYKNTDMRILYAVYNFPRTEETFDLLLRNITQDYTKRDKRVDYYNKDVQRNLREDIKWKFDFYSSFKDIEPSVNSEEGFKEIVRTCYPTKGSLEERFKEQQKTNKNLHDAMAGTLGLGKKIVKGIFNLMRGKIGKAHEPYLAYYTENEE